MYRLDNIVTNLREIYTRIKVLAEIAPMRFVEA
jgi:hypothetical protein